MVANITGLYPYNPEADGTGVTVYVIDTGSKLSSRCAAPAHTQSTSRTSTLRAVPPGATTLLRSPPPRPTRTATALTAPALSAARTSVSLLPCSTIDYVDHVLL